MILTKRFYIVSGYLLFKDFCENVSEEPVPHLRFYEEVSVPRIKLLYYYSFEFGFH